jgi:hypothetical protein
MTETVKGFVEEIGVKSGTSKKGKPWSLYAFKIDGKFYSNGFDKPLAKVGDYVALTLAKDDRGYDAVQNYEVQEAPPVAAAARTQPSGDRNSSIVYQSSRKDAIELLRLMFDNDALPISAAKTAAGKASRYEELKALTNKLAVEFFYDVITLRNLDRVQDAGAEAPAPDGLPEEDEAPAAEGGKWE